MNALDYSKDVCLSLTLFFPQNHEVLSLIESVSGVFSLNIYTFVHQYLYIFNHFEMWTNVDDNIFTSVHVHVCTGVSCFSFTYNRFCESHRFPVNFWRGFCKKEHVLNACENAGNYEPPLIYCIRTDNDDDDDYPLLFLLDWRINVLFFKRKYFQVEIMKTIFSAGLKYMKKKESVTTTCSRTTQPLDVTGPTKKHFDSTHFTPFWDMTARCIQRNTSLKWEVRTFNITLSYIILSSEPLIQLPF